MSTPCPLQPGLALIHSNRMEDLRQVLVQWMRDHPLEPLENELVLVQSNGMAQWLKLALAEEHTGLGISASIDITLPARFLWDAYRIVLDPTEDRSLIPDLSSFDREALLWRIFKQLPTLLEHAAFAPLRHYLRTGDDDPRKRYQLAERLADLLDQYQVYRSDWLDDWTLNKNQVRDAHGRSESLSDEQQWQAELWRSLLEDIPRVERENSRTALHERFIQTLESVHTPPPGLPRRLMVFGISALPQQMLRALSALSKHTQILMCVHNPCRHYWADIIDHKDLFRIEKSARQAMKPGHASITDEVLHLFAHPLLAAWGKQGRDYVRLLDQWDHKETYESWFNQIDLYEEPQADAPLLRRIQDAILDLEPIPQEPAHRVALCPDDSVRFHIAHSAQREIEILHDQLLALLETGTQNDTLQYSDIIVMVPDIDRYAPYIQSVFGQICRDDARYIPYSFADTRERGHNPILVALETLLNLPEIRFTASQILDLLDISAFRSRFNLEEADLAIIHRWIEGSGIRWGLSGDQRHAFGVPEHIEQNTWSFGLNRLLLGYAVGQGAPLGSIDPFDEVGGLDASLLGPLTLLVDRLSLYRQHFQSPKTPEDWAEVLRALLNDVFKPVSDRDQLTLEKLQQGVQRWLELCEAAELNEELPLSIVREAWLSGFDEPSQNQRFLAGRVNFCTLMPMRAIPFKIVCLLGMNDGEFPRSQAPGSFDLMSQKGAYRPGDRSRRDDDRYMFLEALLSARQTLYISWVGKHIRDHSDLPPSLLVGQLREYMAATFCWMDTENQTDGGAGFLSQLTTEHPLQPFSRQYFQSDARHPKLFTYAREWREAHECKPIKNTPLSITDETAPITLDMLGSFLRQPVETFFKDRLRVHFDQDHSSKDDVEPFAFDSLTQYTLGQELLNTALEGAVDSAEQNIEHTLERQHLRGDLPLQGFREAAKSSLKKPAWSAYQRSMAYRALWPERFPNPIEVSISYTGADGVTLKIEDWLSGLWWNPQEQSYAQMHLRAQPLIKDKRPKWHYVIRPWVQHLAASAMGLHITTIIVGSDHTIEWPALTVPEAKSLLSQLLLARYEGLQAPLPIACKTAFAWLSEDDEDEAHDAAQKAYEGGDYAFGERQESPYLRRAFPHFETLASRHEFEALAHRLYQPILRATTGKKPELPL